NYGLNSEEQDFLPDLYTMVGGHPYLTRLAFYYLNQDDRNYTLKQLLTLAPTEEGIYSNHLRSLTVAIEEKPSLKIAVVKLAIAKKDIKLESSVAYQLESLGLISRQGNLVQFSSELYRLYFRDLLIRNHVTIS
nr:AAA-like domain-containing protein [Pleurocapsa sp. MO_192.B19]